MNKINKEDFEDILKIITNVESELSQKGWKGWDPYDGLNSSLIKAIPILYRSKYFRMAWIQAFKHSPINFRKLCGIKKGINPKGIALLLSSYCNLIELKNKYEGKLEEVDGLDSNRLVAKASELVELLIELRSPGYDCFCWGYDFAWQSKAFFLPKNTPTVVATSFVCSALFSFYKLTSSPKAYEMIVSSAEFVSKHLNKIENNGGVGFSYSPMDKRLVFNASLLGTSILCYCYRLTLDDDVKRIALNSVKAVLPAINSDGSIDHSIQVGKKWRDNFHTGFKIQSLLLFRETFFDYTLDDEIQKAISYWEKNFFQKGLCKYFDDKVYPLDIHCPSQYFSTIAVVPDTFKVTTCPSLVAIWMLDEFYNGDYFIFQKKKYYNINIKYFRWGQAWAIYGLTNYLVNVDVND